MYKEGLQLSLRRPIALRTTLQNRTADL